MGEGAFVSSAWRIPFVIGVGLAVVGYVLRRKATTDQPLATVLKTHQSHVVRLTFLRAANIARRRMVTTYSLEYLKNTLHLPSTPASPQYRWPICSAAARRPSWRPCRWTGQARPGVSPGCRGSRGLRGRRQEIHEVDVRYR